jgi:adrenodoxin-NADP+ reductase
MQYAYSVASLIINDHFLQPSSTTTSPPPSPLPVTPEHGLPSALVEAGTQNASSARGGEGKSGKRVVEMRDWERIDRVEVERGRKVGKPREKILSVREMLEVLA